MRASTARLSRTVRAGVLAGLLTLAYLTPASVIHAQSGPPPLTPFHGLIDHVSQTLSGSVPGGNSDSGVHAISGDGRYVVFSSGAWDLVPNDYNGMDDIFLRDRSTGATTRVNVADFTGAEADGISQFAAISTQRPSHRVLIGREQPRSATPTIALGRVRPRSRRESHRAREPLEHHVRATPTPTRRRSAPAAARRVHLGNNDVRSYHRSVRAGRSTSRS